MACVRGRASTGLYICTRRDKRKAHSVKTESILATSKSVLEKDGRPDLRRNN